MRQHILLPLCTIFHTLIDYWHLLKSTSQQDKTPEKDGGNTKAALYHSTKAKMLVVSLSKHYRENTTSSYQYYTRRKAEQMILWTSLNISFLWFSVQCFLHECDFCFFFLHCEDMASWIAQGCGAMAVGWGNTDELTPLLVYPVQTSSLNLSFVSACWMMFWHQPETGRNHAGNTLTATMSFRTAGPVNTLPCQYFRNLYIISQSRI